MEIGRFLDEQGRIKIWPSKQEMKRAVVLYLSEKFQTGVVYTEKEVNAIINEWHTFNDYFLLRRGLIDYKLLLRARDGSSYWKEQGVQE